MKVRVIICFVSLLSISIWALPAKTNAPLIPVSQKEIKESVKRGLDFLVKNRKTDGFFKGMYGNTTGAVALVGMAFISSGSTPGEGPYGDDINRCIDLVLKNKQSNDWLNHYSNSVSLIGHGERVMYSVVLSALFLTEVSGMVDPKRQKKVDDLIAKSIKFILDAQATKKAFINQGGWRYRGNSTDSDLSISGWALMTLKSARLNGADVPDKAIKDALSYVKRLRDPKGGFKYWASGDRGRLGMAGVALTCLELTDKHGSAYNRSIGDFIVKHHKEFSAYGPTPHNYKDWTFYAIYYCAVGTFQLGGDYWKSYSDWLYKKHMKTQKKDGSWGDVKKSTYHTAITVLALTLPYQQLPIYQRHEEKLEKK